MAHGCEKSAFRPIGLVGALLGRAQFIEQLAPLTDVDPAADDALDLARRIAVRQDPVVDRQFLAAEVQRPIQDQRVALRHNALVVGVILSGLCFECRADLERAFADHVLALDVERLQVAVVTGLQQALAVTHVNRMGGFVDQCTHELELVVECALGHLAMLDLPAHVGVPGQGNQ